MNEQHDPGIPDHATPESVVDVDPRTKTQPHANPEGEARSELAVHIDPSLPRGGTAEVASSGPRGVSWVRPTELIARGGATASGRGIDFQAELSRRLRSGVAQASRHARDAVRDRARRLPDLSIHGRDYPASEPVAVEGPELRRR